MLGYKDNPNTYETQLKIFSIYSLFQNNQTYQKQMKNIKQKILEDDITMLVFCVRVMKNILSYRNISFCEDIISIQGISQSNIPKQYRTLQLNEYSKLLVLRLIRQLYFQASYPFMVMVNIHLSDLFQKIGMYRATCDDEQRGNTLFTDNNQNIFLRIDKNQSSTSLKEHQLQHIGYSIHKFCIEILQMNSSLYKLLPFHVQYCRTNFESLSPYFYNNLFKTYETLIKNGVKMSSKFYYFKQDDRMKYIKIYNTIEGALSVKCFYFWLFERLWGIAQSLSRERRGIEQFAKKQYFLVEVQETLTICRKISLETNDRYFWGYLDIYLKEKPSENENNTSHQILSHRSEQQKKLHRFYFIFLFLIYCPNPQLLLMLFRQGQEKHLQYVKNFCFGFKSNETPSVFDETKIEKIVVNSTGNRNNNYHLFASMINYYILLRQLSKTLQSELKSQYYKHIRKYSEVILTHVPGYLHIHHYLYPLDKVKKIVSLNVAGFKVNKQKQAFIRAYLAPNLNLKTNSAFIQIQQEIDRLLSQYPDLQFQNLLESEPINEEDIILESKQIQLDQVRSINSDYKLKFSTPSKYSGYKMNLSANSRLTFRSQALFTSEKDQNQNRSESENKNTEQYSFTKELKLNMTTFKKDILKSLSKVCCQLSQKRPSSLSKSRNSNLLRLSSDLLSKKSSGTYREEYIQSQPLNSVNDEKMQTFKDVYSHPEQTVNLRKKEVNSPRQTFKSRIRKDSQIGKAEPTKVSQEFNKFMDSIKKSEKTVKTLKRRKIPTQPNQQSLESIPSQLSLPRANNFYSSVQELKTPGQQLNFYFLPKTKRELLKHKVLICKNQHIQIGMITVNEKTFGQEKTNILIYLTASEEVSRVSVNIRCPSWLVCKQKIDNQFEIIEKEKQIVSTFNVQLRSEQKKYKQNYGDFPLVNMAYHFENKKYIISEPIPFLITKFCSEKDSPAQLPPIFQKKQLQKITKVHQKIIHNLQDLSHYYSTLSLIHKKQPDSFFNKFEVKEELGIVKLQYIPNHQKLYLLFFQLVSSSSAGDYEINDYQPFFGMQVVPEEETKWEFQDLHIITTCFRSIFSA